jgi:hypothetical protein
MKRTLSALLVASSILPGMAHAQEDLEARIAALEAMVSELKSELADRHADDGVERIEVATPPGSTLAATPSPAPTFQIGETAVRVGGFIDFDVNVTNTSDGSIASASIARDFYIPGATPIGGEDQTVTDFTAEASRLFVSAERNIGETAIKGYVEMDFLGSLQGNERVSNSFSPRLRRAYVSMGGWLAGQEWTTFQNTSAIPESASFLVLSDGMVFIRQPQIRYTTGNFQFALENGDTTITDLTGARLEADSNALPDVVARYNWSGDHGNVSFAAIGRQLRADLQGMEETTVGYGGSVSGRVRLGARDDIRFNVFGGEGLGRYVGINAVNGAAIDPVTGDFEAIPVYGGLIAWRHPFGDTARFNLGYSGLWADQPGFVPGSSTETVQSAYGAILWDIADKTTVGVETMFGRRETMDGDDGTLTRMTVSAKHAF